MFMVLSYSCICSP